MKQSEFIDKLMNMVFGLDWDDEGLKKLIQDYEDQVRDEGFGEGYLAGYNEGRYGGD